MISVKRGRSLQRLIFRRSRKPMARRDLHVALEPIFKEWIRAACEWDNPDLGDYKFVVFSLEVAPQTQVYVQFWSEPYEPVVWEVSSGRWNPPADEWLRGERSRRIEAMGFAIDGEAGNFCREVTIETIGDIAALAKSVTKMFYSASHVAREGSLERTKYTAVRSSTRYCGRTLYSESEADGIDREIRTRAGVCRRCPRWPGAKGNEDPVSQPSADRRRHRTRLRRGRSRGHRRAAARCGGRRGGQPRLADIRQRFGDRVASIVEACSDTDIIPKPKWMERKLRHLEHLRHERNESVLLVSACDKLANVRAIIKDHRAVGDAVFKRFNAPRDKTLWYYEQLVDTFSAHPATPASEEFRRAVRQLKSLAKGKPQKRSSSRVRKQ